MAGDLEKPGGLTGGSDLVYDLLRCRGVWRFKKWGDINGWDVEAGGSRRGVGGWHFEKLACLDEVKFVDVDC